MKFPLILFLIILQISTFAQKSSPEFIISDSLKEDFLLHIPRGWQSLSYFMKITFSGDNNEKVIAMIPKISFMDYLTKYRGIKNEIIEKYIDTCILENKLFPLKDSSKIDRYFKYLIVNTDSLNALNRMAFKDVLNKYFNFYGVFNGLFGWKYFEINCYLFEHFIEADEVSGGLHINSFTVGKLNQMGFFDK